MAEHGAAALGLMAQIARRRESEGVEATRQWDSHSGLTRFLAQGFPSRASESWRYTPLESLMPEAFAAAKATAQASEGVSALPLDPQDDVVVTLVDGRLNREASKGLDHLSFVGADSEAALEVGDLAGDELVGVNIALSGVTHRIVVDTQGEKPLRLRLRHLGSCAEQAIYTRLGIALKPGAMAVLVETFEGVDAMGQQMHGVTSVSLGERAHLDHTRVGFMGRQDILIGSLHAQVCAHARYDFRPVNCRGRVSRLQAEVHLTGSQSAFHLKGAAYADGQAHDDVTLNLRHEVENCLSDQLYAMILADQALGVFQGCIRVERDAQKTGAELMARALLLDKGVKVRAKPELEIFADDVICGHGTTITEPDAEQLYYLRARGLSMASARALLIEAFSSEALEGLPEGKVRDAIWAWIADWSARGTSRA